MNISSEIQFFDRWALWVYVPFPAPKMIYIERESLREHMYGFKAPSKKASIDGRPAFGDPPNLILGAC